MDITAIQTRINALSDAMLAKAMACPLPSVSFDPHAQPSIFMSWKVGKRPGVTGEHEYKTFRADVLSEAFAAADAFIASQPSPEERRAREFMTALGAVIDLGRENGIEVAYVNPLVETMKRLSENALTFQPTAQVT